MSKQTDINEEMRSIVIDWLVDVHRKFKMRMETLFITISIMDRYLEKNQIRKEIFQLVAASSLFIAAKYEEIYPPALEDFVYICADTYNKADIIEMESLILDELEFALVSTSSHNLLGIYTFESSIPSQRILAKKADRFVPLFLASDGNELQDGGSQPSFKGSLCHLAEPQNHENQRRQSPQ